MAGLSFSIVVLRSSGLLASWLVGLLLLGVWPSPSKAQSLVWAGQLVGYGQQSQENLFPGESVSDAITVDDALNVYVSGHCNDTIDFDLGPGQYLLQGEYSNLYLAKYNAQGALLWAGLLMGLGPGWSMVIDIALDPQGNIVLVAVSNGPLDMDPGPGEAHMLVAPGNANQVVLAKYTSGGSLLWARSFGGTTGSIPAGLDVAPDGSIMITASFYQAFDSGGGVLTSNAHGLFFAKYDAEGIHLWSRVLSGLGMYGGPMAIRTGADGSVYLGGRFHGTVDFDPGTGTAPMTATGVINDAFLAKYDSDGAYVWAKALPVYQTAQGKAMSLAVDADGSVVVLGDYVGIGIDLDPGPDVVTLPGNALHTSAYFGRFTPDGDLAWGKGIYNFTAPRTIRLDPLGNILISGSFIAADFDPGPMTAYLTSPAPSAFADVWAKYDSEGNYCWAGAIGNNGYGGSTTPPAFSVKDAHWFLAGTFKQTADLDPGPGSMAFSSSTNGFNSYIARFDSYTVSAGLGGDRTICRGDSVVLDPGVTSMSIVWQDGSHQSTYTVTEQGMYSVQLESSACAFADSVFITVRECGFTLEMPNVFSPNGDGMNETFRPVRMNGAVSARLDVFNRWGALLFRSNDLAVGWNGRQGGVLVPDGVYYWVITCTTEFGRGAEVRRGTVTLLR